MAVVLLLLSSPIHSGVSNIHPVGRLNAMGEDEEGGRRTLDWTNWKWVRRRRRVHLVPSATPLLLCVPWPLD